MKHRRFGPVIDKGIYAMGGIGSIIGSWATYYGIKHVTNRIRFKKDGIETDDEDDTDDYDEEEEE